MLLRAHVVSFPDPHGGWVALAMASTLAGNLTITARSPNIIVVERAAAEGVHVGFREYFRIGPPVDRGNTGAGIWLVVALAVSPDAGNGRVGF
jgi:Na+/H+ antiporter NhaD/arsenite permease-like protein